MYGPAKSSVPNTATANDLNGFVGGRLACRLVFSSGLSTCSAGGLYGLTGSRSLAKDVTAGCIRSPADWELAEARVREQLSTMHPLQTIRYIANAAITQNGTENVFSHRTAVSIGIVGPKRSVSNSRNPWAQAVRCLTRNAIAGALIAAPIPQQINATSTYGRTPLFGIGIQRKLEKAVRASDVPGRWIRRFRELDVVIMLPGSD